MKKVIMPVALAFALVGMVSCGESTTSTEVSADSLSTTTAGTTSDAASATDESQSAQTQDRKYVDLGTGSEVKVKKDEKMGYYVNAETQKRVDFYFDPSTNDTFDYRGRVVNMALLRDASGNYTIDEAKVKVQSDDDLKIKDENSDTKMKLEPNGDTKVKANGAKEKVKGDEYKYKDDSTKIKVKNGQVKVKS